MALAGQSVRLACTESSYPEVRVQKYNSIVHSCTTRILAGGGAPELVTGGCDGCVRVWDPRVPDAVVALEPAKVCCALSVEPPPAGWSIQDA